MVYVISIGLGFGFWGEGLSNVKRGWACIGFGPRIMSNDIGGGLV